MAIAAVSVGVFAVVVVVPFGFAFKVDNCETNILHFVGIGV